MKTFLKIIVWTTGAFLTIAGIGILCTYWWLSTKWTDFYSEGEMKEIGRQVNAAPILTDNFYQAYDKIYPGQRNRTIGKMSISVIWGVLTSNDKILGGKQCNCIFTSYNFDNKVPIHYHSWTSYVTACGLENFTTEEKCLDYNYGKINMETYATKYFDKPFKDLSVDENLELLLRLRAPSYYEKKPNLLTKELNELKN